MTDAELLADAILGALATRGVVLSTPETRDAAIRARDTGPVVPPPDAVGPVPWAELLGATVTALRDVRTMILELHARAATLSETVDQLVARIVDEQAAAIRAERDPIDDELLEELHP